MLEVKYPDGVTHTEIFLTVSFELGFSLYKFDL